MILALALALLQNDQAQANGRDDAWEGAWVARGRLVYTTVNKVAGKVLHVGDSITYSNPYGQWARFGAGKTAEDAALTAWCGAGQAFPGAMDTANPNGYYLCAVDVANRSLTAASGITAAELLSGAGNGATPMPSTSDTATARGYLASASYGGNIHVATLAAAFADAQFAVVMLGTNDAGANRAVPDFSDDLGAVVDVLEARGIAVILSTIPPRADKDVGPYNAAIRALAQAKALPLIDYYLEILARRPGATWQNTLIAGDGIHPTGGAPAADPYAGGDAAAHRTGVNATNDGYLLRSWLTVQKLKEVKLYVADGVDPPAAPPPPVTGGSSSSGGDDGGCSLGTVSPSGLAWLAAPIAIALLRRRRDAKMAA